MFELFHDPKVDFLGKTRIWVSISIVLTILSFAVLATKGLRLGIEFTGGTEVQVKYATRPDVAAIRAQLDAAGMSNHSVTTIGDPAENEVYIRVALTSGSEETESTRKVVDALRPSEEKEKESGTPQLNLNTAATAALESKLATATGVSSDAAKALAAAIVEHRKERAIFSSINDVSGIPGMTPDIMKFLESQVFLGSFSVRSQSYIGPIVGAELIQKAVWAIVLSLAAMLVYIGFRFEFQWGVAAVVALIHDTIVTLGLFSFMGFEMSLPVVAAFLTLVGYSVNDTVVVFDRVRENARLRGQDDLRTLINDSINQTLSRTLLTSSLTWLVCVCLLFLGGPALRDFSFVMCVGIIIGTYSSIYIASPILVEWKELVAKRRGAAAAAPAVPSVPKKVKARKA